MTIQPIANTQPVHIGNILRDSYSKFLSGMPHCEGRQPDSRGGQGPWSREPK